MALADAGLATLAEYYGVATDFWDWKGRHVTVAESSIVAVLAALGVDASSPAAVQKSLDACRDQQWTRMLPPVVVMRDDEPSTVQVHVRAGSRADLSIELEDGGQRTVHQVDNWEPDRQVGAEWIGEASFELPTQLPLGYHRLVLTSDDRRDDSPLIVTPGHLPMPARVGNSRVWGYAAQLYSVRSRASWGTGDFADLGSLAVWSASQQQADYVLINPVHAASPVAPMEPSPYLPASRMFVNPLYIRPETVAEFAELGLGDRRRIAGLLERLRGDLGDDREIRRDECWAAKREALDILWSAGRGDARQMSFESYCRAQGRMLLDFATWSVMCEHLGADWRRWRPELQRPSSPQVDDFRACHRREIEFHQWLQWIADQQLSDAQQLAGDAGMAVGVVTDLAVGVSGASADAWMMQDLYASRMSVGAPPDAYNQLGQDWGQPPWRPDRLEASAYAPFRNMVRNALRHAGGLRMDHTIGLFRLWWVPAGAGPAQGAYMRYDHRAMVGILALEALRAGAVIIGEDLGTVEPWAREYLAQRGILGTSVLWFEEDEQGNPVPAEYWRAAAMASVTTHDLPPTAGYLTKSHVQLRAELGLLTEPLEQENELADQELSRWHAVLEASGDLDPAVTDPVEQMVLGLYRVLRRTPSQVLNATLVDAVGDHLTQNQPGTVDEYPNWRVPLSGPGGEPLLLEDVYGMARPMRLAAVMNGWSTVAPAWKPPASAPPQAAPERGTE